jgi:protoporphyrinogen IX oxidase
MYLYIKALHIIFMVSWFAGLFYLVRLFIYYTEAFDKPEQERQIIQAQLQVMIVKLWRIITNPAMYLTVAFGSWMLVLSPAWLQQPWMHIKLALVTGLIFYHAYNKKIMYSLFEGKPIFTAKKLRFWNEVATIFLVSIVFLVVVKNQTSWIWAVLGFISFGVFLMMTVKFINRKK